MKKHKSIINNLYLSFQVRIVILSSLAIILCLVGYLFIANSLGNNEEIINYTESSSLDYRVYLEKNDFYQDEYLKKDMAYVASLIKNINIDYTYLFAIDKKSNIDFVVQPKASLVISNSNGTKQYFTKTYDLAEKKSYSLKDGSSQTISEGVVIDYKEYNQIANSFRSQFGVDTISNLVVFLEIKKDNIDENFEISNISTININIPLSEKTVDINLDYKDLNENKTVSNSGSVLHKYVFIAIGCVLILTGLFFAYRDYLYLRELSSNNRFDKYLENILNTYDRFIVDTITPPNKLLKQVIKVTTFDELVDARDNLKLPIMHYSVVKHLKSVFYINSENVVYLYTLKASKLGKNNEK